jgi:glycosyltransferase involved in cell wall biosynthesis
VSGDAARGVSVVIPVYKAEKTIRDVCTQLIDVLEGTGRPFEIVLVDDSSPDGSWKVVSELAGADDRVRGIRLSRNFGQHGAILCGLRLARYPVCITMDDDLQHPPEEVPKLLDALGTGYDVVYGTPTHDHHGAFRDLASRITKIALSGAMGADTARNVSAFRALRTHLRDAFADFHGPFVSIDVLLTWGTTRFTSVPVRHEPRREGTSNYTFGALVRHAFNMLTGFTAIPLQLASLLGFALTLFGAGVLVYVFYMYFIHGHTLPGFTFLASMIAIFSGAQLFAIGMIGEYLARMHFRLMDKPAYVVGASTPSDVSS